MRWIRLAPVTAESLVVCVALFVSCAFQALSGHEQIEDVQRAWGAIASLNQFEAHDGVRRMKNTELYGPFDVWNGDSWRIPLTAFHHADLIHLLLNFAAAWYLGRRLEQRWGSVTMGLFMVPAICIPVMSELCVGNAVMGFSGAVCAMLGALVVLRHFDDELAKSFPATAAALGMAMIVLGCLVTMHNVLPFANTAHITGFLYGAMVAAITGGPLRHVALLRISVVLVHLWLVPGLFLVAHPFWVGRYHWYQAISVRNPQQAEKRLERAVGIDPSLAGGWLRWSEFAEDRRDLSEAWRRLINGLAINPSNAPLMDSTRRLWRHLDSRQRREAELNLEQIFGRRSAAWLNAIRAGASPSGLNSRTETPNSVPDVDLSEISLDQKLELPSIDLMPARENPPKQMGPGDFNDAAEGRAL